MIHCRLGTIKHLSMLFRLLQVDASEMRCLILITLRIRSVDVREILKLSREDMCQSCHRQNCYIYCRHYHLVIYYTHNFGLENRSWSNRIFRRTPMRASSRDRR